MFADPTKFDQQLKLPHLHSKTVGMDATINKSAKELTSAMKDSGIKNVVFRDVPGLAHEWQTWRYALRAFAPWLFQE